MSEDLAESRASCSLPKCLYIRLWNTWGWPHPCWNESCHTYEWVMSRIWKSYGTHMNESCHTCACMFDFETREDGHICAGMSHVHRKCVMSHIWMSHVTDMNELCHIYEWVMSEIWMSHVTDMNESCHRYEWVMSHIWIDFEIREDGHIRAGMSHVTRMNESCHTYEWVMSHI